MRNVKISGMGRYLPTNKVQSSSLDAQFGFPLGTFEKKSGLTSRHFATAHETTSYMAARAALEAIKNADIQLHDIDVIIGACGAQEQAIPSTASLIQKQLGLDQSGIPCFDINSTCLSFVTALDIISYLVHADRYKKALIVSSDIPSAGLNWNDMETCSIFGDGAAACILEKSDGSSRIINALQETHSIGSDYCRVEAGGTRIPPSKPFDHQQFGLFYMDGKKVFKLAKRLVMHAHEQLFSQAQLSLDAISWVIPHQASLLAMNHVRKQLKIPTEKFVDIYATHGNQMAASIPNALYTLIQSNQLKRGQLIYMLGTGAGISASGMILEY
jgi:3-oxoacyl-[acyl-carrier-protein] synthase-3